MVRAIATGWPKQLIETSATRRQVAIDRGDQVIVGVNRYQLEQKSSARRFRVSSSSEATRLLFPTLSYHWNKHTFDEFGALFRPGRRMHHQRFERSAALTAPIFVEPTVILFTVSDGESSRRDVINCESVESD